MSALDKITPMFLANAAFCVENGSEVKPETRESIIDTLIKASEELSQANAASLAPTQSADARPVAELSAKVKWEIASRVQEQCEKLGSCATFRSAASQAIEDALSALANRDAAPSEPVVWQETDEEGTPLWGENTFAANEGTFEHERALTCIAAIAPRNET